MRSMVVALLILCCSRQIDAQSSPGEHDSLASYLTFDTSSSLSFLLSYIPPFFIEHGMELKSFVRGKTFAAIRKRYGDLRAVDAIYIRAMKITDNNISVALLISAIACFDHRIIGVRIPIFSLFFPLTNESESAFNRRVNNLPKLLYSDTPAIRMGDRDKLQHFFGSAFIANTFESSEPAEEFSEFIEHGEERLIVDGANDERDIRANRHGQKFGLALLHNNFLVPSEYFTTDSIKPGTVINWDSGKSSGEK